MRELPLDMTTTMIFNSWKILWAFLQRALECGIQWRKHSSSQASWKGKWEQAAPAKKKSFTTINNFQLSAFFFLLSYVPIIHPLAALPLSTFARADLPRYSGGKANVVPWQWHESQTSHSVRARNCERRSFTTLQWATSILLIRKSYREILQTHNTRYVWSEARTQLDFDSFSVMKWLLSSPPIKSIIIESKVARSSNLPSQTQQRALQGRLSGGHLSLLPLIAHVGGNLKLFHLHGLFHFCL